MLGPRTREEACSVNSHEQILMVTRTGKRPLPLSQMTEGRGLRQGKAGCKLLILLPVHSVLCYQVSQEPGNPGLAGSPDSPRNLCSGMHPEEAGDLRV
jgi:hypothetical protein